MGKLFDRVVYNYFNITDKDGNTYMKKDLGKHKAGDCVKLRLDYVEEKIYINDEEWCVI